MTTRAIVAVALAAIWHASAGAQTIVSWGDGAAGTDFLINNQAGTIEFLRGAGNAYRFYAVDGSSAHGTGVINNITIAAGATGDFTLLIDHPTAGQAGCKDWRAGDLRYAGGTCTVTGIDVARYLLSNDAGSSNIYCENIVGDIHVGGSLGKDANAVLKVLKADSVVGNVALGESNGGAFADLDFGSFQGDLTIGDTPFGSRTTADVIIRSSYAGNIVLTDPDGYANGIRILGDFSGQLAVTGVMYGRIEIDGDFIVPGRIDCPKWIDRANGGEPPNVHVHGSLANPNNIASNTPMITCGLTVPDGGLRGTIAIDGDLRNAVTSGPEIEVWTIRDPFENPEGEPTARGSIVVDYDGWNDGDDWEPGATIVEKRPPVHPPGEPVVYTYTVYPPRVQSTKLRPASAT